MTREEKVIKVLLIEGPASPDELIKGLGMAKTTAFRVIKNLIDSGIIERAEDDFTPWRRSSYRVIPTMVPESIAMEIRSTVAHIVLAAAEFSKAERPEHTKLAKNFIDSGVLTINEIKALSGIYEENWDKFDIPEEWS